MSALRAPGSLALGADTVVALGDEALGKPTSPDDAKRLLRLLRGRTHQVVTAVAVATMRGSGLHVRSRISGASVQMRDYSDDEIAAYVASGDPMDKAGGYAIQHPEFRPVRKLDGCYLTVVGLALPEALDLLREAGGDVPDFTEAQIGSVCPNCEDLERLSVLHTS